MQLPNPRASAGSSSNCRMSGYVADQDRGAMHLQDPRDGSQADGPGHDKGYQANQGQQANIRHLDLKIYTRKHRVQCSSHRVWRDGEARHGGVGRGRGGGGGPTVRGGAVLLQQEEHPHPQHGQGDTELGEE